MPGPLVGVRVVDLTAAVLGPVATQILGDMGADVIKIEPPQGDPVRPLGPSRHPGMGGYFFNITCRPSLARRLGRAGEGLRDPRMLTPHRRPFPTKDGHVCILATTDTNSRHLFEALDCPELADDERFCTLDRRTDNIDELYAIIVERMRRLTTAEWRERLDRFDVPNGVITDLEGLLADPYLAEAGFFERVRYPSEGRMLTTAIPVAFSATPGESFRPPPPRLGEDTR